MNWPFNDGSAFPVRDGFDVGGAQERTMGFSVGGFSGQRVAEEVNPDGSITILRTRLGNPIFETETKASPVPADPLLCIIGDLYAPGYSWYPTWYVDPSKLKSTDGIWSIDKSQWKRWTARAGQSGDVYNASSGALVHFNLSSPTTNAVLEPTAGASDLHFTEGPWALRTWHPVRQAFMRWSGMVAVIQRLNALRMHATGTAFPPEGNNLTWEFSDDTSPASAVTSKPACINQSGFEQGVASRTQIFSGSSQKTSYAYITIAGKQLTLKTWPTYGLLPTVKEAAVNMQTLPSPSVAYYANDLAKINMFGPGIHGLCLPSYPTYGVYPGVKNPGYPLRVISGYQWPATTNTRYTKIPGLDVPPDPDLPENASLYPSEFVSLGDRFYNDVVWGGGRLYSPLYTGIYSTLQLSDSQWIHVDDSGVARVLSIVLASPLNASTSSWGIYNHGPLVFGAGIGAGVLLSTVSIVTTDPAAVAEYTSLDSTTRVRFHVGGADVQRVATSYSLSTRQKRDAHGYVMSTTHPVPHSPNGRQIALFRGLWLKTPSPSGIYYRRDGDMIHTVATVDISSSLSVSAPVYVFQWEDHAPYDRVTTFTYVPSDGNYLEQANTTVTPWTDRWCKMIAYRPDGGLSLVTEETYFQASTTPRTVAIRSPGYIPRAPMIFPSEVATDVNMAPNVTEVKGFGAGGAGVCSAGAGTQVFTSSSYRLSNNVLHFKFLGHLGKLITPIEALDVADYFGSAEFGPGNGSRYASWNPRTNVIGVLELPYIPSDPFTSYISWS